VTAQTLRICALYPELMNIYADRGNLMLLRRRCEWRGISVDIHASTLGERLKDEHDLYYLGGGQDADQRRCAADLVEHKAAALAAAAARGAVVLGVCGGYQLLGHSYELADAIVEGIGLLDVSTVRSDGPRLIGNVAVALEPPLRSAAGHATPAGAVIVGFENHAGRTHLHTGQAPLGRVLHGHGNNGHSGFEGARTGTVIGTYIHGPLLPKNAWLCDWLIAAARGIDPATLAPLDDSFEDAAHASAAHAAGQ
jgi:CobQ-like glutamine amidotransferase family enzyme